MPLSDEQAKRAYDNTLQPEEEQPKYWTVTVIVSNVCEVRSYGTKEDAKQYALDVLKDECPYLEAEYTVESIEEYDVCEEGE